MSTSKFDLIDERSDELHEVIGKKPRWVIAWGSALVFIFLILLLIISYVVKYPDVINADVIVTKSNPPVRLFARVSGNINLQVLDKAEVTISDILVTIESSGKTSDLLSISELLDSISETDLLTRPIVFPKALILGDLQPTYSLFLEAYNAYSLDRSYEPNKLEIESIQRKISAAQKVLQEQKNQIKIARQKLGLLEKDLSRNKRLFKENAISQKDLEDKQALLLDQKDFLQNLILQEALEMQTIAGLEQELSSASYADISVSNSIQQDLLNSFVELKNAISIWRHNYTLTTPIDGVVSFTNTWKSNQFVREGEEVIAIVPKASSSVFFGVLNLPINNSGKVKVGQRVNVSLKSFPDHQYGMIVGEVSEISDVIREDYYRVIIKLPNQLKTSYNLSLPYKEELIGTAEIITDDLRLIERILNRIRKNISQNMN